MKNPAWAAAYARYLRTPDWFSLRARVVARDRGRCRRCGSRQHVEVHHLRYRARWDEAELDDLETLCERCHRARHAQNAVPVGKFVGWALPRPAPGFWGWLWRLIEGV